MDNITGFGGNGDEIGLGLNLNSNVSGVKDDFNAIDQILQQMVKDQETLNGIQSDSFDKVKSITQEVRASAEQAQQLIGIFRALRGEQEGTVQSAKQLAATYQQLNNELQKAQQNKTRLGITSPSVGVPGSTPPTGSVGPIPGVPVTQTGAGGGGGVRPPNTSSTAGFAKEPDDFFGGGPGPSGGGSFDGLDMGMTDPAELEDADLVGLPGGSGSGGGARRATRSAATNEHYKTIADLSLALFPKAGYYRNLRRARWLTRNEGSTINKFIGSKVGQRTGLALNRLGGGQTLLGPKGYQLFPFAQNENGDYVDTENNVVNGKYGLQNSSGNFLPQGGPGKEQPTWAWSGTGEMPPLPPEDLGAQAFNPWNRPNLTATGEGAAKIAGGIAAAKYIKARGGGLFREGQLYTGLTGGTGIAGALKYDIGAQATSWFGLNPLESYGQAKQINMQNLALGYRGNLLNQANSFGNQALQKYGVDPQTSMQMFGQMVMQAGVSLSDLNTSLSTLAQTASTTNTSFSQLQQNVIQYSQIGSSIGLTGNQNATFATAAAQFAAGQPGLGATGANPANIMDSMVGQALVAQQMGTSYLGLPAAAQQQGAAGILGGEISVNEGLVNRVGLNKSNYQNSSALLGSYQKFKLLMSTIPGMQKEANLSYPNYVKYIGNMFGGKTAVGLHKTLESGFSQALGQKAGESPSQAIASAIGGVGASPDNSIIQDMQKIDRQQKWKSIGVMAGGKFMTIPQIDQLPYAQRAALESKIATGEISLSHINQHGKLIKGHYANSTLMDLQGKSSEQFGLFGQTPNLAAMHKAEKRSMTIELGQNAKQYFTLIDNPGALNRSMNKYAQANGKATSTWGNPPAANVPKHPK